jgi:hypothetical protein
MPHAAVPTVTGLEEQLLRPSGLRGCQPWQTLCRILVVWCLQALTGNTKGDLPGAYRLADGSRLAVYGSKQWMTPCAWNDWTCGEQLTVSAGQHRLVLPSPCFTAALA